MWKLNFESGSYLQMARELWLGCLRTVEFYVLKPLSFLYSILCAEAFWEKMTLASASIKELWYLTHLIPETDDGMIPLNY